MEPVMSVAWGRRSNRLAGRFAGAVAAWAALGMGLAVLGACGGGEAGESDAADAAAPVDTRVGGDTACVPALRLVCCGASVCEDDGCGPQRVVERCYAGCADGACAACEPACDGRVCGDDGCGGACGTCAEGAVCSEDGRACACTPDAGFACCGDAVCAVDSCGALGAEVAACAFGCEGGECLACDAPCGEQACGDNGCGESCGACEGGAECVEGACVCVAGAAVGCCPEGDARCAFDSCGVVGEVVEACPYGCAAGECEACVADCGERVCGDDGCGGACGSCPEGKACGSDGQCSCTADVGLGCCGDAVCRVDSCGGMGAMVEACPYGCGAAACLPCVPACEGRACGADGCGGTCGEAPCAAGAVCVDGQCVCEDLGAVACCAGDGAALCALDSCGAEIATLEACAYGCDEGACLPCPPACEGRACGPDGCGGICGACSGGAQCDEEAGACVCVPAGATCCGEARCALDSCGEVGDEIEPCSWGCAQGACLPCPPTCGGKACGPDGCGGSCGACGPGLSCSVAGQCLACLPACDGKSCGPDGCGGTCGSCAAPSECRLETGTCSPVVSGRLLRERIAPNASLTALGSVAVVPAAAVPFSVSAGGAVLATGVTAADGTYTALLATAPVGPVTVTFAAVALDAAGAPVLGVADASGVSFPSAPYQPIVSPRVWAWTATGTAQQLALGDLTVTVAQGSGALQLFAWGRELRAFLTALYGVPTVPALGFLWSPSVTPMCLSCFFPTGWGPLRVPVVGGGSVDFTRFIWFSGTGGSSGSPHHWTPSMVGHEYGHYVMDVFSRSPNEGGAHSWDGLLNPGLAWSEGFATFYGQRWLSGDGEQPRFFAVQGGTQYWVDLDRIGTSPTSDDSVFGIVFPLPRATGGLSQTMNEAVIAAILWDLWDLGPLTGETEVAGLDDAVFDLLASPRMLNASYERGYGKADLVDFLDAVRCADALAPAALTGVLMGFPYDNSPSCPP